MNSFVSKINTREILNSLHSGTFDLNIHIDDICNRIDKYEPAIHSLLPEKDRRQRLHSEAGKLLKKNPDPSDRPPLFGMLAGIKDIFRTDGFSTHCGSSLPPSLFKGTEATAVTKLKQAGALILGKTVTTEFAYFEPGPTRNPHNTTHTPGGSSSGSAAAIAAGFCTIALGTQTIGSIIRPASYCGVIGFKPSKNRISTDGIIPFSPSLDHAGFFSQDIKFSELIASVLCKNWKTFNNNLSVKPILGIPEGNFLIQAEPHTLDVFNKSIKKIEQAGYEIKRINVFENIENINKLHRQIAASEIAKVHESWFSKYRSFYRPHTEKIILEGMNVSKQELENAFTYQSELRSEIAKLMAISGIDIWVCPSSAGTAPEGINSTGSPVMNLPWTFLGFPVISLPMPRVEGELPIGLQIISEIDTDEKLFSDTEKIRKILHE